MLLEYGFSNFCSFEGYAYIDLRPAKSRVINRYPNNFVELPTGERVLKDAVIVGENGGGKTNFVKSLMYLLEIIKKADVPARSASNYVHMKNLKKVRALLDSADESEIDPSVPMSQQDFDMAIALPDATYFYELRINAFGIVFERLSFKSKKNAKEDIVFLFKHNEDIECDACEEAAECAKRDESIYGCRNDEIIFNQMASDFDMRLIEALNDSREDIPPLTLIRLATLGEPRCKRILDWLVNELIIVVGMNSSRLKTTKESGELQKVMGSEEYLEILQLVDHSIQRFEVDEDKPFKDSIIVRRDLDGEEFREAVEDDSAGVQQFLYWAYYVYEIVYRDKTVLADEIDSMINPLLSEKVLAYINGNDHRGQLIFTTHNIFNLTLRTFMKEQINFVTKDTDTLESTFYSLADFDEVRYDVKEELYEFYMKGILGGTVDA